MLLKKKKGIIFCVVAIAALFSVCLFTPELFFVDGLNRLKWHLSTLFFLVLIIFFTVYPAGFFFIKRYKIFSYLVLVFSVLLSMQGVYQYFFDIKSLSVLGSFDNPAGYASALAFSFPIVLNFLREGEKNKMFIVSVISIIVFSIFLSGSRLGILCVFIGLFVFFFRNRKLSLIYCGFLLSSIIGLYLLKIDSFKGRLLIWRISSDMIKDKIMFGHGYNGFLKNYMNYQAEYFRVYPESNFSLLASNSTRPFNEYILFLINYGVIGGVLMLILFIVLFVKTKINFRAGIVPVNVLILIALFSLFSYPLSYVHSWLFLIYIGVEILPIFSCLNRLRHKYKFIFTSSIFIIVPLIFIYILHEVHLEKKWGNLNSRASININDAVIHQYSELYIELKDNKLFVFNYASVLSKAGYYRKSNEIANEIREEWSDYNLQMLIGYNFLMQKQTDDAQKNYLMASNMCPSRFLPIYGMFMSHVLVDDSISAKKIAHVIIEKPIKVRSKELEEILSHVKVYLDN